MPTTEAPPPQQPPSARPTLRTRRGRMARQSYEGLEEYDLLHVIDEIEDERARVSLREKIWIALILHILVFAYLLFAPKYIWHVKVRDAGSVRDKDKQVTVLDLPPDALKQLRPETRRPQPAPKPTPERKDLQAPPAPKPVPKQLPPAPTPTPKLPQVAQQPAPPLPRPQPTPPVPTGQNTQLDAPKPQPTKPNFANGPQTPAETVQEAARAARSSGATGSDTGASAPSQRGGNKGAVDVLSDTLGVDFGPYIQRVIYATKRSWYPIIPEVAQPPISKQGRVLIRFKILPDGSVKEMHLEGPSGDVSLDRAAWGGITGASPFPNLPKDFKGPYLELRFYFLYNDREGIR